MEAQAYQPLQQEDSDEEFFEFDDPTLDDDLIDQDRQRDLMAAYAQPEAQNTIWDRLRGYGNQLGQHMGEYGHAYALGAAPLIPAAAALGVGLYGNKQKERPKRRLG
jgi:hypothetical protein